MKQGNAIIKRVFVSDIHMGDQRSINPGDPLHAYGWFQNIDKPGGNHPEMFNDFLENHILKDDSLDELVILGDLFDEWVCPANFDPIESPRANQLQAVAEASQNSDIMSNLRQMAEARKLVYVAGNHDMLATEGPTRDILTNDLLPGVKLIGEQGLGTYATADGIMAEHGHRYTLFNAPWANITGPAGLDGSILPMGHFISRLDAQFVARKNRGYNFFYFVWDALKDLFIEELRKKMLYEHMNLLKDDHGFGTIGVRPADFDLVLTEIVEELKEVIDRKLIDCFQAFYSDAVFSNQQGVRLDGLDDIPDTVAWQRINDRYQHLFSQWQEFHPANVSPYFALINDLGTLKSAAKLLINHQSPSIVIFGHTHFWKLYDNFRNDGKHIYANSGTWVNGKPCTYVVTEFDQTTREHKATLWQYTGVGLQPEFLATATTVIEE